MKTRDQKIVGETAGEIAITVLYGQRKALLSAIKIHRNATESRLKLINDGQTKTMIKADRDLYAAAKRIEDGQA